MNLDEIEDASTPAGYFRSQGYAWYAYPADESAPDCPFEAPRPNDGRRRDIIYYGPIDTATGLINRKRDGGYLCLTGSECAPKVLDGWEVEPAELDDAFEAHDMGTIRLVKEIRARHPELEPFHQYEIEGWD